MSREFKDIKVSVIIPARNEFPAIVFTVHSILNDLETFLTPAEFEIIIVANCLDDWYQVEKGRRALYGTVDYFSGMGAYWNRVVKFIYDPIAGNHSARNKGVELARGKYVFMSDAHMSYRVGYFKKMIETIDKTDGLVHATIGWMGAYPPDKSCGYQYTVKLGDEIRGTWSNYKLVDDYFYIPMQGHCSLGVKREQFLKFGGYPKYHRCYGGGEFYLDSKWWMFGSRVSVEPEAIGYHLRSSRGYSYHYEDYIHNVLAIGMALGMDGWAERAYFFWLRKHSKETMDRLWAEAKKETEEDRKFIKENSIMSYNDLLVQKPWDKLNDELYGKHNSSLLIFHDTFIPMLKGTPSEELFNKSETQKELSKFIEENLSEHIYKRTKQSEQYVQDVVYKQ